MSMYLLEGVGLTSLYLPTQLTWYGTLVLLTYLGYKAFNYWRTSRPLIPAKHGHHWAVLEFTPASHVYCAICEGIIVDGVQCDHCGLYVDYACHRKAHNRFRCKPMSRNCLAAVAATSTSISQKFKPHSSPTTTSSSELARPTFRHHWVHGNLPLGSVCSYCDEECDEEATDNNDGDNDVGRNGGGGSGGDNGLTGYRCSYCQRTYHENRPCWTPKQSEHEECDLGRWKACIVPPYSVSLRTVWHKGGRRQVIDTVERPDIPNYKPIIIVGNPRAGNGDGRKILSAFRMILNPVQVINLDEVPPEAALEWPRLLTIPPTGSTSESAASAGGSSGGSGPVRVRIIVAGGDGSVTWILNVIDSLGLDPKPTVAIIPLGTGNDLSRVLGWGESFSMDAFQADRLLRHVLSARTVLLDRWNLSFSPLVRSSSRLMQRLQSSVYYYTKSMKMNNYFSIGVDALVTLNFHRTRQSRLYQRLFSNRLINKAIYSFYGTKDALERGCANLHEKISLDMDGVPVEVPQLESIVLLNIPSWAGGHDLWSIGLADGETIPEMVMSPPSTNSGGGRASPIPAGVQSINDRRIEVMGLYSTFHIGQLMIGLSSPLRFGQAKSVRIKLTSHTPVQADGEPWLQPPSVITVSFNGQSPMLSMSPI